MLRADSTRVMCEHKVGEGLFTIDKLMSGSSLESKAHKTPNSTSGKLAAQNPDL